VLHFLFNLRGAAAAGAASAKEITAHHHLPLKLLNIKMKQERKTEPTGAEEEVCAASSRIH